MQQNDCANPRERRCRLGNYDAELEQLSMDLGGSPQWVLEAHSSDQERHFSGNPRPAGIWLSAATPAFPMTVKEISISLPVSVSP
jgi:hypothetical protein